MEMILDELSSGLPDAQQFTRVVIRMLAAALLGAVVGIQRERAGKPAGVRTHMLVSMGAALFVVACLEWGMGSDAMSEQCPYEKPRGISQTINPGTMAEAERIFAALSDGGEVQMPLAQTFWALRFGTCTDRFGIPWMVNLETEGGGCTG